MSRVGSNNIEQDFVLSNPWQGGSRESAIAAAQPQATVTPPPAAPRPVVTLAVNAQPAAPAPQPAAPTPQPSTPQPSTPQSTLMSLLASRWAAWSASVN